MADLPLPSDVVAFIHAHINSVEQLEVLLLMRGSPEQEWSAADVSDRLKSTVPSVSRRLADLQASGLVSSVPGTQPRWRFSPPGRALTTLSAVAAAYGQLRYRVIDQIFGRRVDQASAFASAFCIRSPEDDGG